MIGSLSAELLILRKRAATWVLLGIWLTLATMFAYVIPYLRYRNALGTFRPQSLTPLLPEGLVGNLTGGYPFFGGAIVLILGVLTLGSDYGWGTLKTLFTQRPGRLHVFAAKLIALAIALVPFVLLVFVIGALASYLVAQRENAAVDWPSLSLVLRGLAASWFLLAVWATLGVLLAVVTRGTALAIGIGILWALVVEGLISALFNEASLLRPLIKLFLRANGYSLIQGLGGALDAADNGPGSFSGPFVGGTQAALVLGFYLVAFVGLSALILRRRDVV
jgi:ABC-type transport system involved in multi-copper enzyme maturation permease subunit